MRLNGLHTSPLPQSAALLLAAAGLIPAFLLTGVLVARNRAHVDELRAGWSARGAASQAAGRSDDAVADYLNALAHAEADEPDLRLRLAESLQAAGRFTEAEAQLLTLYTSAPGNGIVNLGLARLAAARGDLETAVRHYHGAIDGAWDEDGAAMRRVARRELSELLLAAGDVTRAEAELLVLSRNLDGSAQDALEVAALLVAAGVGEEARPLLDAVLVQEPGNHDARLMLGRLLYEAGDYAAATRAFETATPAALRQDDAGMLDTSRRVLALDPYARRIGTREQAARVRMALSVAAMRIDRCRMVGATAFPGSAPALDELKATVDEVTRDLPRAGARLDADALDSAMTAVFAVTRLSAAVCGAPTVDEQALALIAAAAGTPAA